jgi:hypothetical protein
MTAKIQIEDTDLFAPGAGAPGDLRRHPPFRRTLSGCHVGNRSDSQGVALDYPARALRAVSQETRVVHDGARTTIERDGTRGPTGRGEIRFFAP